VFLNVFFYYLPCQTATLPNGQVYHEDILILPLPKSDYSQIVGLTSMEYRNVSKTKANSAVTGSPYLFENWNNLTKVFFRDKIYSLKSCNYNIYEDHFEAKLTQDSVFVFNSWNIKKIIVNNHVFSLYPDFESQKDSYFEELIDFDNHRILSKHKIKVMSGSINPLTKEKLIDDEFIKKEDYYLYDLNDNTLTQINLNKSSVQSLFSKDKLDHINKFVKDYHLKYNKVNDVVKMLQYYNTL
jgi:hypothetical protein